MCNKTTSRLKVWGSALPVLLGALTCQAETGSTPALDPVPLTVQQMLDIDTRLALKKELQLELEARGVKADSLPRPLMASPTAAPVMTPVHPTEAGPIPTTETASVQTESPKKPHKPALVLDGIFGTGRQLYADVLIDGQKVRYKRDQRSPLGYDISFAYQLVSIDVPCVQLSSPNGQHRVCINGQGD